MNGTVPDVPGVASVVDGLTGAADDSAVIDSRTKDLLAFIGGFFTPAQVTLAYNRFKANRAKLDTPPYTEFLGY
jgi:hypothetical protein